MFLDNLKNRWLSNKSELISVLASGILISSIIFFFGPFVIYSGNVSEFRVSLIDILKYYAIPGFVLLAVFLSIGMVLSKKYVKLYVSVIFGIGVLMWLQGNIFVWKYGLLDGHAFDWTKDQWRGWVDGALWLLLLAFSSFFYKTVYRFAILGSIALICLQTMYLGFNSFQRSEIWKSGVSQDYVTPKGIYEFSSKRNVIQFILDAFQSDIFQDIIDEDPDRYYTALDGFTFFTETTGSFPTTYMSVPAILSGKNYKNDIPMPEFVKRTLNGETITNVLYDKGYEVDLVHGGGRRYFEGRFSSAFWPGRLYGESKHQYNRGKAAFVLDLVLFRYAPHLLKTIVYNDQSWLVQRLIRWSYDAQLIFSHSAFLEDLIANMSSNRTKPVYKFIHIMTTHSPLVLDENCKYAGKVLPFTRKNLKIQCKCGLDAAIEFFERLKSLGIYQSSLIILQADHGAGMKLMTEWSDGELDSDSLISSDYLTRIVASALPLLAVKPPHSKGPLRISNAQAMLTDIPATISSILNLDERFPGRSVFDLDSEEIRERKTYHYTWQRTNWQDSYFYRLDEYIIKGSVFDKSSWRLGARYNPGNNLYETERVDFGTGDADRFLLIGWGRAERDPKVELTFNWALGNSSSIVLSLPKNEAVRLTANVKNFLKSQSITIKVDGEKIGIWDLSNRWVWESHSIVINPEKDRPDVSVIEFIFSQYKKPKANEKDKRPLAVLFDFVTLNRPGFKR